MKRLSQKARILASLKKHERLTTYTAFMQFHITNLPKRICELLRDGHKIKKGWKLVGTGVRVREYRL